MTRIPISPAAAALLRAFAGRAGVPRDRILLSDAQSIDWRSLTFSGERHELHLRVPGPDSRVIVERLCDGLENAEFSIPRIIVADVGVARTDSTPDGTSITIEALTVAED